MSNKINLLQMQHYFEGQVGKIRLISDLALSENDYRSLGTKLKALCFFTGSENDIEDYMLSIIVYSTYTLIYGEEDAKFDAILKLIMSNEQYMERTYLNMFRNSFDEFGINTFGIDAGDLKTTCKMILARHAGVPNYEKNQFFDMMSKFIDYQDVESMCEQVYELHPPRAKKIASILSPDIRNEMILDARMLVKEVYDGRIDRNYLLDKYPKLSISLIDYCLMWNDCNKHMLRFNNNY